MRIALIGTPDSGKTELGEKLSIAFGIPLIDCYATDLADETGLYIGYATSYVPNLLVTLERFKREFSNLAKDGRITCGTAVETMAYCALFSSRVKADSSPEDIDIDQIQAATIMNSINLMMDTGWRYDFVFYLPTRSDSKMNRELDYAIREVLATLHLDHSILNENDGMEQAMRVIWSKQLVEKNEFPSS